MGGEGRSLVKTTGIDMSCRLLHMTVLLMFIWYLMDIMYNIVQISLRTTL